MQRPDPTDCVVTSSSLAASNEVKLTDHSQALWEGLFDARAYIDRYDGQ